MPKHMSLIVGSHFRPPAKQVLAHLASGTELILVEDNENAYDAAAVRVNFDPKLIPESEFPTLEHELLEAGITLEQLMSGGDIQLGFIPAQEGKPLAKIRVTEPGCLGNLEVREIMGNGGESEQPYKALLDFAADGSPRLAIIVQE